MLAPVTCPVPQSTPSDSFESLLHAARSEALAVLCTIMHLGADSAIPAAVLRERRLAATAILRVPCEPAKQLLTTQAPIAPPPIAPVTPVTSVTPVPAEQAAALSSEVRLPVAPSLDVPDRGARPAQPIGAQPPAPPFKPRRGATPIASLRRRSGAPHANAGEFG